MESKNLSFTGKYLPLIIGICGFSILVIYSYITTNNIEKSIAENERHVVGVVYKFYSNRSNNRYYYSYTYKNRKYRNSESINGYEREKCVGRYYLIKIADQNPEYSLIQLDQEITDSLDIKKADCK